MKEIGLILLFFGFGVLPSIGLPSDMEAQQTADLQSPLNSEHRKFANDALLAQGLTEQETSPAVEPQSETESENSTQERNSVKRDEGAEQTLPNVSNAPTEPVQAADSEEDGTIREVHATWEKTQRIFKVINDYELAPDEVLTTLVLIAGSARLQGSVTGNVLVIGGNVELVPGARVNGTLHLIGGEVTGDMEGIADFQVNNRWQMVPAAVKLVMHPHAFWGTYKQTSWQLTLIKLSLIHI